jgi:hypothetical protein
VTGIAGKVVRRASLPPIIKDECVAGVKGLIESSPNERLAEDAAAPCCRSLRSVMRP